MATGASYVTGHFVSGHLPLPLFAIPVVAYNVSTTINVRLQTDHKWADVVFLSVASTLPWITQVLFQSVLSSLQCTAIQVVIMGQ